MRAVGVHADVIVATSAVWETTCTAVRAGDEAFVIDSPVLPEELELLPALLEQAGVRPVGLLATHADWDHLLGRLAFPALPLGCAQTSALRLAAQPGTAQRELRAFDDRFYLSRARPLSLGAVQELPVPGRCELGPRELELHEATGHTADGMAVWIAWARVLVCGDYLSPLEIPMVSPGGDLDRYARTLDRLAALVAQADWVIPGHGAPLARERARRLVDEDRGYLAALAAWRDGGAAPDVRIALPERRGGPEQRAIDAANRRVVAAPAVDR